MGEKTETCALCTCHHMNHLSYTLPLRSSSHKVGCAPVADPGLPLVSPLLHAHVRDRSEMRGCMQHATSVERKITALGAEQAGILQDANELGVELTIGEPLHVSQPAAIFDDNMEYARLVGELEATESMNTAGNPHLAALNGAIGRDIIARLHSTENRAKLDRKLLRLERRLGITQRWTPEHPEFKVRRSCLSMGKVRRARPTEKGHVCC